jgi:hypothetical protein
MPDLKNLCTAFMKITAYETNFRAIVTYLAGRMTRYGENRVLTQPALIADERQIVQFTTDSRLKLNFLIPLIAVGVVGKWNSSNSMTLKRPVNTGLNAKSINQPINQSTNQPINHQCRCPCLAVPAPFPAATACCTIAGLAVTNGLIPID